MMQRTSDNVKGKTSQISGNPATGWIERCVLGILSAIPISEFGIWVKAYFHPVETFEAQKGSITIQRLCIALALVSTVFAIANTIITILTATMPRVKLSIELVPSIGAALVFLFVAFFIGFSVVICLLYAVAKILSGKGKITEHAYAIVALAGALYLLAFALGLPFYVLAVFVPDIAMAASVIGLLVCIYAIYDYFVLMRHVHRLSSVRAALLFIIPVLVAALMMILGLFWMLSGMIGGMR